MLYHNLKYSLKVLLRNKALIFWTFAFPIILAIFFKLAFSDIENKEKLDIINIAIINNEEYNSDEIFKNTFAELSNKDSENYMFNITYTDEIQSKEMLKNNEITGYLLFKDNEVNITVKNNGINETILRHIVDEIQSNKEIINNLIENEIKESIENNNFSIDYKTITENIKKQVLDNNIKLNNISNKNLSYTMIEFYTVIAMACLYGAMLSMYIVNMKLPNMSNVGKRISISPSNKNKIILGSLFASYILELIGISILLIFTSLILKVDYGNNLPLVFLTAIVGSLAGLSLGLFLATVIKTNENAKIGILISVTMLECFLSGMMGITMKYIIDKNIPIINRINPANMITDALYSLYYYDSLERYSLNILSLLIFSIILIVISSISLRRQKYDSI